MKPSPKNKRPIVLPNILSSEVQAVVNYLQLLEHSQRQPEATARLLVLVVKMHHTHTPWPTRGEVARHLGISMPLVDVAISQRQAQGLIRVVTKYAQGFVKRRGSVIMQKFVIPSPDLIAAVESAAPRPRRARAKVKE